MRDCSPIKQVPRLLSPREKINKITKEIRNQGVIEELWSLWLPLAVLVKKKNWTIRFCVNYRKLNAITVKDSYPLPRIDDILDQLLDNSWFSTLDLESSYWQIKISYEDKAKTFYRKWFIVIYCNTVWFT